MRCIINTDMFVLDLFVWAVGRLQHPGPLSSLLPNNESSYVYTCTLPYTNPKLEYHTTHSLNDVCATWLIPRVGLLISVQLTRLLYIDRERSLNTFTVHRSSPPTTTPKTRSWPTRTIETTTAHFHPVPAARSFSTAVPTLRLRRSVNACYDRYLSMRPAFSERVVT